MSTDQEEQVAGNLPVLTMAEFLESCAPNQIVPISDIYENKVVANNWRNVVRTPEIQLHCGTEACNGTRFFRCFFGLNKILTNEPDNFYLKYRCSNCQATEKVFSVSMFKDDDEEIGQAHKFGEYPPFGPPTPSKLVKMIGPDRDEFLNGRRCENQGLGVGAFIYYRRVVERQKNRILNEIIKVSEKLSADSQQVAILHAAVAENQFSTAMDMAKDALPESLLINGHSPIRLLHSALSEGVHALSDAQCLELAGSVRIVLGELAERLGQALKDEAELSKALSTLMNLKQPQAKAAAKS